MTDDGLPEELEDQIQAYGDSRVADFCDAVSIEPPLDYDASPASMQVMHLRTAIHQALAEARRAALEEAAKRLESTAIEWGIADADITLHELATELRHWSKSK